MTTTEPTASAKGAWNGARLEDASAAFRRPPPHISAGFVRLPTVARMELGMLGRRVPDVTFKTRVRDERIGGDNPFRWQDLTSGEVFQGRRVVLFALPGAFTPTCTTEQCPAYEAAYEELLNAGADEVYCLAVNDAFVMYQWTRHLGLTKLKVLPDGSGDFTRRMGMLVKKDHLGFGQRSWRYSAVVDDGVVRGWFEEPGINDHGADDDPYGESAPDRVLQWLQAHPR